MRVDGQPSRLGRGTEGWNELLDPLDRLRAPELALPRPQPFHLQAGHRPGARGWAGVVLPTRTVVHEDGERTRLDRPTRRARRRVEVGVDPEEEVLSRGRARGGRRRPGPQP